MKKYIDKIILVIFYLLTILAFFCLVGELPHIIHSLFSDEPLKENYTVLSFFFCSFILGYTFNYYMNF